MSGNLIVKDSCLRCKNLGKMLEFGICECGDYAKGKLSQAEQSWIARHGKLNEIQKPYRILDVEASLRRVIETMEILRTEGEKLCNVTKSLNDKMRRRSWELKRKNAKFKITFSISGVQKSELNLEQAKRGLLKKSDDLVVLGVLDGSVKGLGIQNWIEKKAGVR
jgi:hypothetical protein